MARQLGLEPRYTVLETVVLPIGRLPHMAEAVGFEPTPVVLETTLYGFEDRCATFTLSPY